jgi:hypothetical protein
VLHHLGEGGKIHWLHDVGIDAQFVSPGDVGVFPRSGDDDEGNLLPDRMLPGLAQDIDAVDFGQAQVQQHQQGQAWVVRRRVGCHELERLFAVTADQNGIEHAMLFEGPE